MSQSPFDDLSGESKHQAISIDSYLDESFEVRYDSTERSMIFYKRKDNGMDSLIYDADSQTLKPRKGRIYSTGVNATGTGEARDVPYSGSINEQYVDNILASLEEIEVEINA